MKKKAINIQRINILVNKQYLILRAGAPLLQGPEASAAAARFQEQLAFLNVVVKGLQQRFVHAVGGVDFFNDKLLQAIKIVVTLQDFIAENEAFGPVDVVWESPYTSSDMQGGAFRLPNGNTLITDCDSAYIFEVSEDGEIVWTYEGFGANNIAIARAQKYPIDFFDNENNIIGDLNGDYEINILDIVLLVNQILSENYILTSDINNDGLLNILDIVLVVNLILDN